MLNEAIVKARAHNSRVWGAAFNRPNAHTGLHIEESAALYGVPNNVNAGRFEARHSAPKSIAAHSNHRVLERQMLIDSQVQEAVHYVAKGGPIGPLNTRMTPAALRMLREPDELVARLLNSDITDYHGGDAEGFDEVMVVQAVASRSVVWGKFTQLYSLDHDECKDVKVAFDEAAVSQVKCFSDVGLPGREMFRAHVVVGEHWRVRAPTGTPVPTGPSLGVAIARIQRIIQFNGQAFVGLMWLGRMSTNPQQLSRCHRYELRTAARYPRLVPAEWLDLRTHVHDACGMLMLNSVFIK